MTTHVSYCRFGEIKFVEIPLSELTLHEVACTFAGDENHSCLVSSKSFLDHEIYLVNKLGELNWILVVALESLQLSRHKA